MAMQSFDVYGVLNINDRFEIFHNLVFNIFDRRCPVKSKSTSAKRYGCPWMTDNLKSCTISKHRLYKLSIKNPTFLPEYKRFENIRVNTIRAAKKLL